MQPLAATSSCRGEQLSHAIAIRSSSAISPTNSHLGMVWAIKSQGREKGEFTPALTLVDELNAEIGCPSSLCLIQVHRRTPCSRSASLGRAQALAFDNCKLTFLLSLPWPLWWGAGKGPPCALQWRPHTLSPRAQALGQPLHTSWPACLVTLCSRDDFCPFTSSMAKSLLQNW